MDQMSQRQLTDEVRTLIDRICDACFIGPIRHTRCGGSLGRLHALMDANPHSIWSYKVLHNIGLRRRGRLRYTYNALALARARSHVDASDSLADS